MTDKGKLHMDWHRHKREEIRSNSSSVNLEEIYSEDRQMRVNKKGELVYLTFSDSGGDWHGEASVFYQNGWCQ